MRRWKWLLIIPMLAVVFVSAGTWAYIQLVHTDAPGRLSLSTAAPSGEVAAPAGTASAGNADDVAATSGLEGAWSVASGSEAGYRVKEVLFGQSTEAVGRTSQVDGRLVISGTTITAADVVVDMTTVASDEDRRDNQFRGRIMNVATYPTATFTLTEPIQLGSLPADGTQLTVPATGTLTLRGATHTVSIELTAQRSGSTIKTLGSIPVAFADYGIPNPSFGGITTDDHGEIEFLVTFSRR
jgi:polyisoprenoid-binding protein YceI